VKDKVFVPPQPVSIPDLKKRITAAVETITPDLLSTVWQELDYCLDVCCVTKGPWPAQSPILTPCDYFLWGYMKDKVFVQPQPMSIPDLKNRITVAVETITPNLLSGVWQELDYRLDVCHVTKGAYIEHL